MNCRLHILHRDHCQYLSFYLISAAVEDAQHTSAWLWNRSAADDVSSYVHRGPDEDGKTYFHVLYNAETKSIHWLVGKQ